MKVGIRNEHTNLHHTFPINRHVDTLLYGSGDGDNTKDKRR